MGDTLEKNKPKENSQNEKSRNMEKKKSRGETGKVTGIEFFLQNGKRSWTRKKER
jgi:hypothetical protein